RSADSHGQGAHPGHLGRRRSLPRPRTRRARARRRPQPGSRRAPARRLALGAPRRGRARHATAHRLLRPCPARQGMTQAYSTLRVAPGDDGVLGVVIDAPPMNLIGPELVHDLVGLLGELGSGQETRVMVLESADPEYFVPHVDLTKVAEYTAEAAKAGGPDDASLGMLWHKLSELPVVTIAKIRGEGPRGGQRTGAGVRHAVRRAGERHPGADRGWRRHDPRCGRRAAPGPAAGT